eukprot:14693661-Alexandrium_andersonii.AAC.1
MQRLAHCFSLVENDAQWGRNFGLWDSQGALQEGLIDVESSDAQVAGLVRDFRMNTAVAAPPLPNVSSERFR